MALQTTRAVVVITLKQNHLANGLMAFSRESKSASRLRATVLMGKMGDASIKEKLQAAVKFEPL